MEKIRIEKTARKGYPCYWEQGGGFRNTGEASIICNKAGLPKKPIYIRNKGHLANSQHALLPVEIGDFIINAKHWRKNFEIRINKVVEIEKQIKSYEFEGEIKYYHDWYAIIEEVYFYDNGNWNAELPAFLEDAVKVSMDKATCYHCREPHYVE